jgi:tetratricopeptide (TPR) repeat protein
MRDAVAAFQEAIARDSGFAPAWAGLADVYAQVTWAGEDAGGAYAEAKRHAERALALDPGLAEAHATLGLVRLYRDRDWDGAERELRRALELNPSYATAFHWYGSLLAFRGDFDEGLEMLKRAEELDPISAPIRASAGMVLYYAGRHAEAGEQCRRALEIDPRFWPAMAQLAQVNVARGRSTEALSQAREAMALSGGNPMGTALLAVAYARAGRRDEARRTQTDLRRMREEGRYVSPVAQAVIHSALGEAGAALDSLEAGVERGDDLVVIITAEPLFAPLHPLPRYQQLVRRARHPLPRDAPRRSAPGGRGTSG